MRRIASATAGIVAPVTASTNSNTPRFDRLDALRGVAIVWMAVFHFCFDLAYFGGLTYLQAELRTDVMPIVTEIDRETGTQKYYSAIIVKSDSSYQKIEDLKGKKFAFGDISSTSGSLYPRFMLDKAGFANFTDPQTYVYTGGHDATLAAVINGSVRPGNYTIMASALVVDELRKDPKVSVHVINPADYHLPFPGTDPHSEGTKRLQQEVKDATAVILATPEYHGSFSSVMKLVIENLMSAGLLIRRRATRT